MQMSQEQRLKATSTRHSLQIQLATEKNRAAQFLGGMDTL